MIKKTRKREYAKNRYYNMTGEEMQKHKDCRKNYHTMYRKKKKEQGKFGENAVLTPPKTVIES